MLLALAGFHHGVVAHPADVGEAHVGHGRGTVQSAFLLHLPQDVAHRLLLVLAQVQGFLHQRVALDELAGRKAYGDACRLGMVFDEVHDGMDAAVYGPSVLAGRTEVAYGRFLLVACDVYRVLHQFAHSLVACG